MGSFRLICGPKIDIHYIRFEESIFLSFTDEFEA